MKISEKLQYQLDRLKKVGAFRLQHTQKQELKSILKDIGANELVNLECGTCVRRGMHDLNSYLNQLGSKPVLSFKGVKQNNELTFNQLRTKAKSKGFKPTRKTTKVELLKFLSNDV
jgi:hypothetical protein